MTREFPAVFAVTTTGMQRQDICVFSALTSAALSREQGLNGERSFNVCILET